MSVFPFLLGNGWISGGVYTPTEAADLQSAQNVAYCRLVSFDGIWLRLGLLHVD